MRRPPSIQSMGLLPRRRRRRSDTWVQRHQQSALPHRAWDRDITLLVIVDIGLKSVSIRQRVRLVPNLDHLTRCQVMIGTPDHRHHQPALDILGRLHLKCNLIPRITGAGDMERLLATLATCDTGASLLLTDRASLSPPLMANPADRLDR